MRIFKSHPLLKLVNSYVIDSPQPSNISYLWNFGSLLAFCLVIQIITGVTLAMHYNPSVLEAFNSVEHIMRDVNNGWLIRYLHSNTASAFFFIVYLHIGRGLYYGSYKAPRTLVWTIGTVIFILMMATAFLGYKHSPKWPKSKILNKDISSINYNNKIFTVIQKRHNSSLTTNKNNNSNRLSEFLKEKNLDPIYIYEDLEFSSTKKAIQTDLKDKSGVYLILNKVTLDYYVGSASTNKFYSRFSNHLFNFNGSKIVKAAVRKYKINTFAFVVLELFPHEVTKKNNKGLLDLEDFYLKSLLPNYNILTEAGSSFGYKHTEISRIKMRSNYSIKRRDIINGLSTVKLSDNVTLNKMKKSHLTRQGPSFSEGAILATRKRSKALMIYNLDYTVYGKYGSIVEAANDLGCDPKTIRRALKTDKKILKKRFIVKHI